MPPPFIPQLTSNADSKTDITTIISYLYDLDSFLNEGDVDGTWSSNVTTSDRVLNSGDTLPQVINVLATLIAVLKNKGIL